MSQTKAQLVSGTTAQDLTVDNINTTSVNSGQVSGRKNLIINGAMQVAQRATTYTGADNYNTVDRIKTIHSGLNEDVTSSQHELSSSDTPYSLGFRHSYHIQNGNQSGGAGTADLLSMQYRIEAQDLAKSGWDYKSTSSYVTLSFWVKSSVAQSFGCFLRTHDGTQLTFPFETGALTADAWTKITRTIPGNASMGFSTDNGTGIEINISQFWGTDYTASGQTLDAWSTYSNSARLKDFPASTWYTTNDATFEITGLQLEVGSTATDFEHRSFEDELKKCKRYFQHWMASYRWSSTSSQHHATSAFPPMRAIPTVVRTGDYFGSYEAGSSNANVNFQIGSNGCIGQTHLLHYGNSSSTAVGGYGTLSAEL